MLLFLLSAPSDENPFYLNDPKDLTPEEFCEKLIAPDPNCFRGVIPTTPANDNCKCVDHKCHKNVKNSSDTSDDESGRSGSGSNKEGRNRGKVKVGKGGEKRKPRKGKKSTTQKQQEGEPKNEL